MQTSLTFGGIAALFGAMVVLALIPGVSVLTVSARSAASGFVHGVFTTLGIVAGDIVFILLAVFGLSVLADTLGGLFVVVKYLGGAYLIWFGVGLWRKHTTREKAPGSNGPTLLSSFLTGLFITLGDQKAVFFYLGFFPAFLDLSKITYDDTLILVATAAAAVGGAKLVYAFLADRAGVLIASKAGRAMHLAAGCIMIAAGLFLVATA